VKLFLTSTHWTYLLRDEDCYPSVPDVLVKRRNVPKSLVNTSCLGSAPGPPTVHQKLKISHHDSQT
jgi:hypothetical protein